LMPVSALQHLAFCERQWGLIHLENVWEESLLTAEGRILHDKTHQSETEVRGDLRIAHAVRIRSLRLGLSGQADVIEFHKTDETFGAVELHGVRGLWKPFPVEYKRGKPKFGNCDKVQLCAQALCLEEMLSAQIAEGALFYGKTRRRLDVEFDTSLRSETEALARRLHELFKKGVTPQGEYSKKCDNCSLLDLCKPKAIRPNHSARDYLRRALIDSGEEVR